MKVIKDRVKKDHSIDYNVATGVVLNNDDKNEQIIDETEPYAVSPIHGLDKNLRFRNSTGNKKPSDKEKDPLKLKVIFENDGNIPNMIDDDNSHHTAQFKIKMEHEQSKDYEHKND